MPLDGRVVFSISQTGCGTLFFWAKETISHLLGFSWRKLFLQNAWTSGNLLLKSGGSCSVCMEMKVGKGAYGLIYIPTFIHCEIHNGHLSTIHHLSTVTYYYKMSSLSERSLRHGKYF